jgi:hypothetical protein
MTTGQEFIDAFDINYDRVASNIAPGYSTADKLHFINKAQEELLLRYYDDKEKALVGSFDSSEKIKVFLSNIIKPYEVHTTYFDSATNKRNGIYIELPSDFLFCLLERTYFINGTDVENIWTKPVTYDEYNMNKYNPYKQPDKEFVFWRFQIGKLTLDKTTTTKKVYTSTGTTPTSTTFPLPDNKTGKFCEIIGDGSEIQGYYMNYLKTPVAITASVCSELPEIVHNKIIDIAVRLAVGVTNVELYQVKMNEENISK